MQPTVCVYGDVDTFDDFSRVVDPSIYRSLTDDWQIGVSDVVRSRDAIAAGRYRSVNMAGAAVISALTNAFAGRAFPFTFAGDGARFAVPPEDVDVAREAMAKTASWAKTRLDLDLRVGLAPVRDVRNAGYDVQVARYAPSPHADYAMFSGGGIEWVEEQLKAGRFTIEPAPPNAMPDLTGLSCQWGPIASRQGVILSMIVRPAAGVPPVAFAALITDVFAVLSSANNINPVPDDGPHVTWPSDRLRLQAKTMDSGAGSNFVNYVQTVVRAAIAWILFRTNLRMPGFDPMHYRRQMAVNTDYRKYDDGLMMTVDCAEDTAGEIERHLKIARKEGIADYGLHRQATAVMTCVAPSVLSDDHLHFLDGGEGGYTRAAQHMHRAAQP